MDHRSIISVVAMALSSELSFLVCVGIWSGRDVE